MRIRKRAILVVLAVVFVLFVANAVEGNLLNRAGAALKEENYPLALERIKPLAMLGDSTAQQLLGWMYAFGNGTPANPDEALKWFRRSSGWCKKDDGKVGAHAYLDREGLRRRGNRLACREERGAGDTMVPDRRRPRVFRSGPATRCAYALIATYSRSDGSEILRVILGEVVARGRRSRADGRRVA